VVNIDPDRPDSGAIGEAAAIVEEGGLVAFPTETVYGIACRVADGPLARLSSLKERVEQKHYTLHIGRKEELTRYVPCATLRAQKLVRKVWPGPVTVVFDLDQEQLDKQRGVLEKQVFENLYKAKSIGIRCPENTIAQELLTHARCAVVAPSANKAARPPATDAKAVISQFAGQIEMILDGGPCRYKKSSTVVKVARAGLTVLRDGAYSPAELMRLSTVRFLFVCTGNTCRSPMAEAMFRKYLAQKLDCELDQVKAMGYMICSAGTMGVAGLPASSEAVAVCASMGIDISGHKSRGLSKRLVEQSDLVFVMSQVHRERVLALCPDAADRCILLDEAGDVPDPIGQSQQVYDDCARRIDRAVKKRICELKI